SRRVNEERLPSQPLNGARDEMRFALVEETEPLRQGVGAGDVVSRRGMPESLAGRLAGKNLGAKPLQEQHRRRVRISDSEKIGLAPEHLRKRSLRGSREAARVEDGQPCWSTPRTGGGARHLRSGERGIERFAHAVPKAVS